ncbi:MAG TPA: CopD family protein [Chitinophagaceae bacterium]|jgi:putative membrane protein|nr:CopD family protein [Chitinophagaceae bacterium]
MYNYVKALHIIFIVTWFSGLFYIVRLFIYNTEAGQRQETEKTVLREQFGIMIRRLWLGITWPSALLTLVFGLWMLYLYGSIPAWLQIKLVFVFGLFLYHFSLQRLFTQQMNGVFKYSSQQLRIWNEVATIFLLAIVMLVVVKQGISLLWGLGGLLLFATVLMSAIRVYKLVRSKSNG